MSDLSSKYVLQTAGFDARFPNTNQTRHCFQNYTDYFKCIAAKGEEFAPCKQFKRAYNSLCPNEWVSGLVLLHCSLSHHSCVPTSLRRSQSGTIKGRTVPSLLRLSRESGHSGYVLPAGFVSCYNATRKLATWNQLSIVRCVHYIVSTPSVRTRVTT
ncbi:Cytochrome c oxidase subunit 6B, variant 2 [Taiwanofungus camphoratus]|nr:Cytochrome c oxidase subunit 6B, variant 2 [Antrodia cinnamomea]